MKIKKVILLILSAVLIFGVIYFLKFDYINYQIEKRVLSPINFINKYAEIEIPSEAEVKSFKYVKSPVGEDESIETLQATVVVPAEQINYIIYGQSTVPVPDEDDYVDGVLSWVPTLPEDISPTILKNFNIKLDDVEIYQHKPFSLWKRKIFSIEHI